MIPRLNLLVYYLATFSSRFIIANINNAAKRQRTMNTLQTAHNGSGPHNRPPTITSWLPIAVATNQPPIIIPLYFGGATLVTKEIPIGLNSNSAKVRIR